MNEHATDEEDCERRSSGDYARLGPAEPRTWGFARSATMPAQFEAVLESESRLKSIFLAAPVGIGLVSDRILLDVNDRLCEMVGYRREEMVGRSSRMLYPNDEEWEYVGREKYRQIRERGTGAVETRWRRKDGKVIDVLLSSAALDPEDLARGVTFTALDITDRKRTEDELRSIFCMSLDMICIADIETATFIKVNPAFERTLGYTEEELLSRQITEFIHPADVETTNEVVREKLRQGRRVFNFENRYRCKDGSYRWLSWTSHPRPEQGVTYAVAHDITERKQAERELQERERQLRTLMGNLPGIAYRCANTPDWPFEFVSEGSLALTGYEPGEIAAGGPVAYGSLIHPDDRQMVWETVQEAVRRDVPFDIEYRIRTKDGVEKWVSERGRAVPSLSGTGPPLEGLISDITERKRAAEAIRNLSRRNEEALRVAHMGHWEFDVATGVFTFNDQYYALHGTTAAEAGGYQMTTEEFARRYVHPDDAHLVPETIRKIAAIEDPNHQYQTEARILRADGEVRWVTVWFRIERDARGRPTKLHGVNQDITERRCAEEALHQLNEHLEQQVAQRTEALTHTVARLQQLTWELSQTEDRERKRIADLLHDDVQQILAAARFHLNLLAAEIRSPEESHEIIEQVRQMLREAINKARCLSHELSPALYQVELVDILTWLADHMEEKHGLVVHMKPQGRVDSSSEPLKALLYKVAQELLFNIVKHAGISEATVSVRRAGRYICLLVVDRGRGFDPSKLEATPGFGLMSIRERVQLLGGQVRITSTPDRVSRILIAIPDQGPS